MKKLILITSLCVLVALVLPASATPVKIYSVSGPQDGLLKYVAADEVGTEFPADELIENGYSYPTTVTACPETPGDDPQVNNMMVTIRNMTNRTFELWWVGDTHFEGEKGGPVYDTTCSNYDGFIGNAGKGDAGYAFKIDNVGVNKPLYNEIGGTKANLFEPGEYWYFIIQDYVNIYGGTPTFSSIGIASDSSGYPPSTGSLIANLVTVPEPTTIVLLGIGSLTLLRRKRNAKLN